MSKALVDSSAGFVMDHGRSMPSIQKIYVPEPHPGFLLSGRNFGLYSGEAAADGLLEWRDDETHSDTTVCKGARETGMEHGGNREKRVWSDLANCTISSKRRIDNCGRTAGRMLM